MPRVIPRQWVNMQTGELTMEALRYLDDLENGVGSNPSIGTVTAGVNAIIAGTQPLADVIITGVGSVASNIETVATNTNSAAVAASAGALTASVSPSGANKFSTVGGSQVTNAVTVTPSGGTGPYTYAWTKVSGTTVTITSPTAASTTFSITLSGAEGDDYASAIYRCTVTDSLAATYLIDVPVTVQVSLI